MEKKTNREKVISNLLLLGCAVCCSGRELLTENRERRDV